MNISRFMGGVAAMAAIVVAVVLYSPHQARGSDHQDSPTVVARPAADITDVFVFPAGDNPNNVVLAMNVYPLIPAGMSNQAVYSLDPSVMYQLKIAHGAKPGVEDTVIQFSANTTGQGQQITMYGPANPNQTGTANTFVNATATVPFNKATTLSNGMQVFVGPRSDPFYFDLAQFFKIIPDRNYQNQPNPPAATATGFRGFSTAFNTANGTTCDTSQATDLLSSNGFNVITIMVEMPKSTIAPAAGSQQINVWATTNTVSGS